jgi:hypothetical protein
MRPRPAVFVVLVLSLAACSKQRNHEERRLPDGTTLLECNVALRSCLAEAERLCRNESFAVLGANNVVRHYGADAGDSKVVLLESSARIRCLSRGAEPPSLAPEERAGVEPTAEAKSLPPPPQKASPAAATPPKVAPAPAEPRTDAHPAPADKGLHCVPGASQACVGPGGCQGGQVCLPDGGGLGPCDCGAAR